jgi:hypothetical protein
VRPIAWLVSAVVLTCSTLGRWPYRPGQTGRMIDAGMIHVRCIHQDDARFWKSSLAEFFQVHAIDDAEQAEIIRQLVSTKRYMSKDGLWTLTVVKR